MKIAKRILAIAVTVLMIVSTCAVAASAAGSLQAAIDAADGSYTLTANVTESIVIDKDFTLDLNGHSVQGERGKVAITVNGANVTITNGRVVSRFADVSSAEMLKTVKDKSPAAIRVNGGSLTINGVSVSGGMTRIPTQQKYSVSTGSAIEALNGADVTLYKASLYGRYGVNNAVTGASKGGKVTVYDAIIIGAMRGIRTNEVLAEGTEKVNAADHLNGMFNGNKKLTEKEINLIKTVLGDRVYAYARPVDSDAAVTIVEGEAMAEVTASVDDSNIWPNRYSTTCSYKYIPEYAVLSNGQNVKMTSEDGVNYTASVSAAAAKEGVQVRYRVWAEMQEDVAKYAINARYYLTKAYDKAIEMLDYQKIAEKYDYYMDMLCDLWKTVDELPNPENNGEIGFAIADSAEFKALQQALFNLGGAVMLNGNQDYALDPSKGKYYIGYGQRAKFTEDPEVIKDAYAPLDSVGQIKDEFDAQFGVLNDDSLWGDIAYWAYEKIFEEGGVIDILFDAKDAVDGLVAVLEDGNVAKLIDMAGYTDKVDTLKQVAELADTAIQLYDRVMESSTVQNLLTKAENNKELIPYYVDKAVYVYHNLDEFITPEKFVNGNDVMGWCVFEDAAVEIEEAPVKVEAAIIGEGTVTTDNGVSSDVEVNDTHNGVVTLSATPAEGCEFLYWANNAGNIISTDPDLTLITKTDRELSAHFGYLDEPTVTFASSIGNVVGEESYVPTAGDEAALVSLSRVDTIDIPGFTFGDWPGKVGNAVNVGDLAPEYNYYGGGSSAFAISGASYSKTGHVLAYRPGSNALILIPSFNADQMCTLVYNDNGATTTANIEVGKTATYTATGDNFSYWQDAEGNIVSVEKTYSHQVVRSAEFTAVYGAEAPDWTINIVWKTDDGVKDTFYAERSVKSGLKVLSSGIVFGPATVDVDTDLVVNSTNSMVKKGTSRNTNNNGTYAVSLTKANFPYAVVLRPYVEIEGVGIVYGPTVTRN
ncbi:MAG: hypothetical protein ACI4I5_09930 [Acutalibacteraceae bacterium]